MIHDLKKNPKDLPPVKKGNTVCGDSYHISERVIDQDGNECWYNFQYEKWCFEDWIEREVISWTEKNI